MMQHAGHAGRSKRFKLLEGLQWVYHPSENELLLLSYQSTPDASELVSHNLCARREELYYKKRRGGRRTSPTRKLRRVKKTMVMATTITAMMLPRAARL